MQLINQCAAKAWDGPCLPTHWSRIVELSKSLGIFAVEVDATDKEAQAFYLKYGFLPLLDKELHLFLPLATFEKHYSKG